MPSTALHPKGPRVAAPSAGALAWVDNYLASSVGRKILVALTGLFLTAFLVGHMIGNLKMFEGPEAINHYAYVLKHDFGLLLWIVRGGLLGAFLLHLFIAVRLQMQAAAARPVPYAMKRNVQGSFASRTMLLTGLVIGAFTLFHLAHYTFAWVHNVSDGRTTTNYLDLKYRMADGRWVQDVYAMVVSGFTTWWISVLYVIAQLLLFLHLSHGIASALTTLGLVGKRFAAAAKWLGYGVAAFIVAGNLAIVVAVWAGVVK